MSTPADTDFVKGLIDDKCDPELGAKVRKHLEELGLETVNPKGYDPQHAFSCLENGIRSAYDSLGLDIGDPSIQDTPRRFAKMFVGELTKGLNYDFFPKCTATPNGREYFDQKVYERSREGQRPENRPRRLESASPFPFPPHDSEYFEGLAKRGATKIIGKIDEAVMVKHIRTTSLCEHHLQTIDGFTHIAYIPGPKVLGLSKFARVVEFFAARPQIQERMTEQIYHALCFILDTPDVAVVVDAVHFCMRARGVRQPESWTQTNKMGGRFMNKPELRKEFLDAIANQRT